MVVERTPRKSGVFDSLVRYQIRSLGEMPTNNDQHTDGNQPPVEGNQPQIEVKFDDWLSKQDEPVRKAYESHVTGLKHTVQATRQERDDLAKQIKDLLPKAEKGSEVEKSLADITVKLEAAEKRAVFAEDAIKPDIGCSNPKAAYLLAIADGLFDKRGNPDWAAIKSAAPELFVKASPRLRTHAGDGTGTEPPNSLSMNDYIRQAAGHRI
jgi:hypothetical protein